MYQRRILCTLYGAVDFFIVPSKGLYGWWGRGGGRERVRNATLRTTGCPPPIPSGTRKVTLCTRFPPPTPPPLQPFSPGIFKHSMGARNREGSGGQVRWILHFTVELIKKERNYRSYFNWYINSQLTCTAHTCTLKPFISTERSFLKHFVQCNRSHVFKYQRDLHFFPENQMKWLIMPTTASRIRVVVPARQGTQPGGIGFLESILGLLKSLNIRAQNSS